MGTQQILEGESLSTYLRFLPELIFQPPSKRGGFQLKGDYPENPVNYSRFHQVYSVREGVLIPQTPTSSNHFNNLGFRDAMRVQEAFGILFPDSPLGEICVRTLWYPPQEVTLGTLHSDCCFASFPLYDSAYILDPVFFGLGAEPWFGSRVVKHRFRALPDDCRIYRIAFAQLDPDFPVPDGRTYREYMEPIIHSLNYLKENPDKATFGD